MSSRAAHSLDTILRIDSGRTGVVGEGGKYQRPPSSLLILSAYPSRASIEIRVFINFETGHPAFALFAISRNLT